MNYLYILIYIYSIHRQKLRTTRAGQLTRNTIIPIANEKFGSTSTIRTETNLNIRSNAIVHMASYDHNRSTQCLWTIAIDHAQVASDRYDQTYSIQACA